MIPKQHKSRSFEEVSDYLLHDKKARSTERVEWTHTENLRNLDTETVWKQMSATVNMADRIKMENGHGAGRRRVNPAYHLSLSWAPGETPDKEEMITAGKEVLKKLGLQDHQCLMVCHNDEPHPHIHMLVNRVNRETGLTNRLPHSKRKLSEWAMGYEQRHNNILCKKRVENNEALKRGESPRYRDDVIKKSWENSKTGAEFQSLLVASGYTLAHGNRRIVVVDRDGKASNPTRQLYGVKSADIKAKIADLDLDKLPTADEVKARIKSGKGETDKAKTAKKTTSKKGKAPATAKQEEAKQEKTPARERQPSPPSLEYWDREQAEVDWQIELSEEGSKAELPSRTAGKAEQQQGVSGREEKRQRMRDRPAPQFNASSGALEEQEENRLAARLHALESKQAQERIEFHQKLDREYGIEKEKTAQFYDVSREERELQALEAKDRLKVTEVERVEALRASIANSKQRESENYRMLETRREKEMERFDTGQQERRDELVQQSQLAKADQEIRVKGQQATSLEFNQQSGAELAKEIETLQAQLEALYSDQTQQRIAFDDRVDQISDLKRLELTRYYDQSRNLPGTNHQEREALERIDKRATAEKQAFAQTQRLERKTLEQALDAAFEKIEQVRLQPKQSQPDQIQLTELYNQQAQERQQFTEQLEQRFANKQNEIEAFFDASREERELQALEGKSKLSIADEDRAIALRLSIEQTRYRSQQASEELQLKKEWEQRQFESRLSATKTALEQQAGLTPSNDNQSQEAQYQAFREGLTQRIDEERKRLEEQFTTREEEAELERLREEDEPGRKKAQQRIDALLQSMEKTEQRKQLALANLAVREAREIKRFEEQRQAEQQAQDVSREEQARDQGQTPEPDRYYDTGRTRER